MKKEDFAIILLLFALMLAWPAIYRKIVPPPPAPEAPAEVDTRPVAEPVPDTITRPSPEIMDPEVAPAEDEPPGPARPEQRVTVANEFVSITVSSHGAGIVSAKLKNYRAELDPESPPLILDFSDQPGLIYSGLPGFSGTDDFDMSHRPSERSVFLERSRPDGVRMTRLISLGDNYEMRVDDMFVNRSGQVKTLPGHLMRLGRMKEISDSTRTMRQHNFGVDVLLSASGEGVTHWASKLPRMFRSIRSEKQLDRLPETITVTNNTPVDWVAAKDKFFVQILGLRQGAPAYEMQAGRRVLPGEAEDPRAGPRNPEINSVSASAVFPQIVLDSNESYGRETDYYVGPKKLTILQRMGFHKDKIMDFGWWTPVCKLLLRVLNAIYAVIPNYGVAIILLTILIRIVFWPLTHKSADSMKKMQMLQPEMKEIRNKHKGNPKLMQAETMALYKKHKVNPMSGCLPMLIQIPVFIALFVVLRSAIELRFAGFLWISDLSEPEGLLADMLPIPLNILPIIMAVTMVWQQKLMPTTDPNQQKMMTIFMPAMMLVMFYNMPSALVLYWSASQCIMIGQQLIQKKKAALKTAATDAK